MDAADYLDEEDDVSINSTTPKDSDTSYLISSMMISLMSLFPLIPLPRRIATVLF